jgi:hypothetical protein
MASGLMTMNDVDHRELLALRDQFLEMMRRTEPPAPFDQDARRRVGELIGRSARHGRSEYAYSSPQSQ